MTDMSTAGALTPGDKFQVPPSPAWFTVTRVQAEPVQPALFGGAPVSLVTLTVRGETMDRAAPVTVSADMRVIVP